MSFRVHHASTEHVHVAVYAPRDAEMRNMDNPYGGGGEDLPDGELRLIIEDSGNGEAFVIDGDLATLAILGDKITKVVAAAFRRQVQP